MNSSRNHGGDFFWLSHQERVFGNRHGHTGNIDFLESVSTHRVGEHLTGNRQHRHRVHVGISDSGHQVGRPWPRGRDRHTQFARRRCIAFGCVPSALFVAYQNVADFVC